MRQVQERALADLIPYEKNARTHTDAQIDQIAASITEFGWTNPILVDHDNILAGHGRVRAAIKLGMTSVPCIDLAGLSDSQRRAYIIADNKLALNAGWDARTLAAELHVLEADEFNFAALGFNDAEIGQLFAIDVEPRDRKQEWAGMPEFELQDKTGFHALIVHFADQEALEAFAQLVQQPVTQKTRYIWYPMVERDVLKDKRYVSES